MHNDHDFSSLRNLLALRKLEMPLDTGVERFLIELHRRQRAQLLVPASAWDRSLAWLKEKIGDFGIVPSLSYGSALAAIAVVAFFGLSQQVSVTQDSSGQYDLSLRIASSDSSFALLPTSLTPRAPAAKADSLSFTPVHPGATMTRFILADNSRAAYDATAAF